MEISEYDVASILSTQPPSLRPTIRKAHRLRAQNNPKVAIIDYGFLIGLRKSVDQFANILKTKVPNNLASFTNGLKMVQNLYLSDIAKIENALIALQMTYTGVFGNETAHLSTIHNTMMQNALDCSMQLAHIISHKNTSHVTDALDSAKTLLTTLDKVEQYYLLMVKTSAGLPDVDEVLKSMGYSDANLRAQIMSGIAGDLPKTKALDLNQTCSSLAKSFITDLSTLRQSLNELSDHLKTVTSDSGFNQTVLRNGLNSVNMFITKQEGQNKLMCQTSYSNELESSLKLINEYKGDLLNMPPTNSRIISKHKDVMQSDLALLSGMLVQTEKHFRNGEMCFENDLQNEHAMIKQLEAATRDFRSKVIRATKEYVPHIARALVLNYTKAANTLINLEGYFNDSYFDALMKSLGIWTRPIPEDKMSFDLKSTTTSSMVFAHKTCYDSKENSG